MIIEKKHFNFFNSLLKESKSGGFSSNIVNIVFSKNSIDFEFAELINYVSFKVDTKEIANKKIENPNFFISVVCSELENNDVELTIENNKIKIGEYLFNYLDYDYISEDTKKEFIVNFDKEQFKEIEKDFDYTLENYFINPTATDVIGFGICQGTITEVCPGAEIYKLGKFPFVNSLRLEQNFGHEVKIILFPHYIYNMFKEEENISFDFNSNYCYVYSDNISVEYTIPRFGTNVFLEKMNEITNNDYSDFNLFTDNLRDTVNKISKYSNTEVEIIINENDLTLSIDDNVIASKIIDYDGGIELSIRLRVLNKLFEIADRDTVYSFSNNSFIVRNNDEFFFIPY